MVVDALITGVEEVKYNSKKDNSPQSFHKVNFIDSMNPAGSPQSASLSKDPAQLTKELEVLAPLRMKLAKIHVYQNGNYTSFGGFVK